MPTIVRPQVQTLVSRLSEPRRHIQVIAGPRQVGKSTLVQQALARWGGPALSVSADEPSLRDRAWLVAQWEAGRVLAAGPGAAAAGAVLVLDEIQKIPAWSETVKHLWDEDGRRGLPLRVVVLGSAPLLLQRGLGDSLAGRFETLPVGHWTLADMRQGFGFGLDEHLCYGGYPGAAPLAVEPPRWARHVKDALIETVLARDVLLLTRVDKPALLRRLFELGCRYSGQVLSYTKMLGQLQDAGNTTTLAHYLELLGGAGMLTGLGKYCGGAARGRASSPKLQVYATALIGALQELDPAQVRADREMRGHLVESAIGAHLVTAAAAGECRVHYWREGNREVDFVVERGRDLLAIEVKSGRRRGALSGLAAFTATYPARPLLVGADGIAIEEFLEQPVGHWFG